MQLHKSCNFPVSGSVVDGEDVALSPGSAFEDEVVGDVTMGLAGGGAVVDRAGILFNERKLHEEKKARTGCIANRKGCNTDFTCCNISCTGYNT